MIRKKIETIFAGAGIRDIGFCKFSKISDKLLDCRARARIPENSKTVILCLFPYKVKQEKPRNLSRYAAVPDYHKVCMNYLKKAADMLKAEFSEHSFEPFIDNSPIPEVEAAALAGLGVIGENGLLISKNYGSWVFIGEILTTLEIEAENSIKKCSVCGVCRNACSIGLSKAECLSAVSQQKKVLSAEQKSLLFENKILWGCDKCAESCPENKASQITYIKEFIEGYRDEYIFGEDISGRAFEWRGEGVIRRNFENLNSPDNIQNIIPANASESE